MKKYTKKQIKNIILRENNNYIIFKKKNILLKENSKNSYVEPSGSDNVSSLANDISKSKTENPGDSDFIFNANSYDGNSSNNTVTLDISGNNPTDASNNFKKIKSNPNVRQLMNKTNVNAKVHLRNEQINRLRESSVSFTKKEIKNLFK